MSKDEEVDAMELSMSENEDESMVVLPCQVIDFEDDTVDKAMDLRICKQKRPRVSSGSDDDAKGFRCDKCEKTFTLHVGLLRHMKCHYDKPYACSMCGLRFRAVIHLERHVGRHNEEKHFKCDLCGKFFSSNWNLKAHMRLHTGEKPYKCSMCASSFTYQVSLHRHELSHTGERAFMCHACGKRFSMKDSLSKHLVIHSRPLSQC